MLKIGPALIILMSFYANCMNKKSPVDECIKDYIVIDKPAQWSNSSFAEIETPQSGIDLIIRRYFPANLLEYCYDVKPNERHSEIMRRYIDCIADRSYKHANEDHPTVVVNQKHLIYYIVTGKQKDPKEIESPEFEELKKEFIKEKENAYKAADKQKQSLCNIE